MHHLGRFRQKRRQDDENFTTNNIYPTLELFQYCHNHEQYRLQLE